MPMCPEEASPNASTDVEEPPKRPPTPQERKDLGDLKEQVEALEAQKETLAARVDELEAENEELTERLARAKADYANYKKRAAREKQEAAREARVEMIKVLAEVADNVQRALDADPSPDVEKGLELVTRSVQDEFESMGVDRIEPSPGDPFDPERHEATILEESEDHDPETVLETLQTGYRLEERQIRPAMVKVAKAPRE